MTISSAISLVVFTIVAIFCSYTHSLGLDGFVIAKYSKTIVDYILSIIFILKVYPKEARFIP